MPAKFSHNGPADTPVECITDLLTRALEASESSKKDEYIQKALAISSGLDDYTDAVSTLPSSGCAALIKESFNHDWKKAHESGGAKYEHPPQACAGQLEGNFFKSLVSIAGAKEVLEVGMFTGTTALAIAEALPEDGKVTCLEIDPYLEGFVRPHFQKAGLEHKLEIHIGDAGSSLEKLAQSGKTYDVIFVDADKPSYKKYYDLVFKHNLLALGGVLAVDNTIFKGESFSGEPGESGKAIRAFNEAVVADPNINVVVLPVRDGISLITRKQNATSDRYSLTGQVAMVTGGAQGLGLSFAEALGEAGASVAIVDINGSKAEAASAHLQKKGIRSIALQADVTNPDDCTRMVKSTVEKLGALDIALNNAGINASSPAEETSGKEWSSTFNVNTHGVFYGCQAEARHMLSVGRGKIINTGSMASLPGYVPNPQKQAAYNASKAAVVKLTQSLAVEWGARGINVNSISPGIVETDLIKESKELQPLVEGWISRIPAGRLCYVDDLKAGMVFLASRGSDYLMGHNLVIDGGQNLL